MEVDGAKRLSRREFILKTGGALAVAAVRPGVVLAREAKAVPDRKAKKVRIGVVGGGFGADFQWHLHPDCVVQAVSDLREDRRKILMNAYKCSLAYNSLEELIKDKNVNAVAVFTGALDHVRHAIACMEAGKHVISAVPACQSMEEAEQLLDCVKRTGLTYMMAETSYYRQPAISARKFYKEGKFGRIFFTQAEYFHPHPPVGSDPLWIDAKGNKIWRYGLPPMHYPTHSIALLLGVTGERLVEVSAHGWDDGTQVFKDNQYSNPFGCETAFYKTNENNTLRHCEYRRGAVVGTERAEWIGEKMSFYMGRNLSGPVIVTSEGGMDKDDAGFAREAISCKPYDQPKWWESDMLPEPMRVKSGHDNSHTFLCHEFVDALIHDRKPAVNIYEALAYTVPGIIAHQSALQGGRQMKIPVYDPA